MVKRIIEKITGEAEYKSPTDMGVNRAGFGITDDKVCREAANQEIIRRYLIAECDYKKGKITESSLERAKLLMKEVGLEVEDRPVVLPARECAEEKRRREKCSENIVAMAIELPNGEIITGKSSRLMVAAAAMILNAIKHLANQPDEMLLIAEEILETTQRLKTDILKSDRSILNCEEILIALAVSKSGDKAAELAASKLKLLRGCRAHCTAILSDQDEQTLRSLGIDVTCDPEYVTTNLYTN